MILRWLDPRIKTEGAQAWHYITTTTIGLILALLFAFWGTLAAIFVGRQAINWAERINAQRTAEHVHSGVVIPTKRVPIAPVTGGTLGPTGGIFFRYFMGTTQQSWTLSCAAQSYYKLLGYQWNVVHPKKQIKPSPRQGYDIDTGGANIPTSISDYDAIVSSHGIVPTTVLSYGPHQHPQSIAPYATEPVPSYAAYGQRIAVHSQLLWYYPGAGSGAVERTKEFIAHHRPVAFGSDWYYNAASSAWTTGKMGLPVRGDWVEYAHATVIVRYNDAIAMPDGTHGAFLASNSFGALFGRDKYGNINRGHGGYVWISYAYFARYAAFGQVLDLGAPKVGGGPKHFSPSHAPLTKPPFDPGYTAGGGGLWVHDVHYYNDARYPDISAIINDAAAANGISGVGLAATLATESNLRPSAPHYPIAGAGACDYSGGISQFTVCTIYGYGVGDGSQSWANIQYVLNWENTHPVQMIQFAANLLGTDKRAACIDFYALYVAFNAGAYAAPCGSAWWWNPGGLAGSNLSQNFLPWWNYANAYWSTPYRSFSPPPPKPRVFPRVRWNRYVTRWNHQFPHHKRAYVPYLYHGKVARAAQFWAWTPGVINRCGSPVSHEVWWAPKRYRFERQQFDACVIYSWPTHRGWQPKVARR